MPVRTRLVIAAAFTALALTACGGADGASGDPDDGGDGGGADSGAVTVVATEFEFDPGTLTFPSGTTVLLDNQGVIEHDFAVEDTDVLIYADAGTAVEDTVDLDPGSYTFYCSIPGHRASGMEGSLTVE